jgi:SNF2 family DNA or RNA helicase
VIVCNIKAGGVGHTLTAASDVAFVEFGWNPSDMDQAADRCHRIGQTDSVTAWQLVAEHDDGGTTIEGELVDLIASKRSVVTTATDGLGIAQQSGMLTELMDRIKRRTRKEDVSYEANRADAFDIKFGV